MKEKIFPFIRREEDYFVIGAKDTQSNEILLSKNEIKRLKSKLNEMDIDKFYWKSVI